MKPMRPVALIQLELDSATRYRDAYRRREPADDIARQLRAHNEAEIARLTDELRAAMAGDLEISLTGVPVSGHDIQVSFFNRLTDSLQAAYRAAFRAHTPSGRLRRGQATLSIVATSPGSFRVALRTSPVQLDLLDDPASDRAMDVLVDLFQGVIDDPSREHARAWATTATEAELRAMVRVASTMASSRGVTQLRWRPMNGLERMVAVAAGAARDLAMALAGEMGREVLTVEGHLQMGQDEPPRARITTRGDEYFARVTSDDLLEQVKALLFDDVRATLLVETRTSPTSGTPSITTELLDIAPAPGEGEHSG